MFYKPEKNILRSLKRTKRVPRNPCAIIRIGVAPIIPIAQAAIAMPKRTGTATIGISSVY